MMRHLLSLFTFLIGTASIADQANSHEIVPNMADVSMVEDKIMVSIRINAEAYLADIDLSQLSDTEMHQLEKNQPYANFRSFSAERLELTFKLLWDEFADLIQAHVNGKDRVPIFKNLTVDTEADPSLPRLSQLQFLLTDGQPVQTVSLQFSKKLGTTIVRQVGVEGGLTQYLEAGQKSELMFFEINSLKADYDDPTYKEFMKKAETATKVMRGDLLYRSEYKNFYKSFIYYYEHNRNIYACYFSISLKKHESPVALCVDQAVSAERMYPDRFKSLEPYLRLPASILHSGNGKQIGDQEFNGTTWTFHSTETSVYMCSSQFIFLVCKENTDPTILNLRD